jgi:O-antigen ligase
MASKGFKKDSLGISLLTDADISLIEKGITNYKFKNSRFSIYPRIYETIWELDYYFKTGDPNNKTLAQRIEFVKASFFLIKRNLFFGIGTGNWVIKYNEAYDEMNSKLLPEKRGPSHNQYLNYMVKFGVIGFLWIMFALIVPVFLEKQQRNLVLILFLISIAAANFGDANLETHMGLSFFVLFYSLFLWNSTDNMQNSLKA